MGGVFSQVRTEGHGDGFGVDQAVGKVEVLAHAGGVDFKARDGFRGAMQGSGGEADQFWQRLPFGVPVTKAAFVLLSHGPEDGGGKGGNALGGCEDGSTGDRVAFLRHGGGTAATLPGGLGEFADLVCVCSERSRAILPRVPVSSANVVATSATRSRWACQGRSGSGSFSSSASA